MKKNTRTIKYLSIAIILLLGVLFVAKFGGPSILRLYVATGIGTCEKIPILCLRPAPEIISPKINQGYIAGLPIYASGTISMRLPNDFTVIQEKIKKVYYKKGKRHNKGNTIYLLHKGPGFFINLFPQLSKARVDDDYEFIQRTMYANLDGIKNLTDSFFVIMKGIFIPDLGDLKDVTMLQFELADKKGFINYNLTQVAYYFDCNIIDRQGNFFKVYIKDKEMKLDLDKVLAIISTIHSTS